MVDGTNPAEITPDGYDDVVCHVPTTDLSDNVDASDISNVIATVCLTLNDGYDNITVCADDQLKVARSCE